MTITLGSTGKSDVTPPWASLNNTYRCHVCFVEEEDGTFSAIVLNLPGCGSCGDTMEEAERNVREAIVGVIESYVEAGEGIPWCMTESEDIPRNATLKWILVNA